MTERRWAFMSRKVIGRQDNPMLVRWRLVQTPWFGIYLHFIAREDLDRMPHDHPWTFRSVVLRGGYHEEFWPDVRTMAGRRPEIRPFGRRVRGWVTNPRLAHRFDQGSAHRITAVLPDTVTLVLVGRKRRTWGFYDDAGRFIDWRDYHQAPGGWSPEQGHPSGYQQPGVRAEVRDDHVAVVCVGCGTPECAELKVMCPDRRVTGAVPHSTTIIAKDRS